MATSRPSRKAPFFDPPAGFDDPMEMLSGCHRRIERQLETLKRLHGHVGAKGVDAEASAAAHAVLQYFLKAAANHHADEEQDLFPLLERRIASDVDRARFRDLRERIVADHRQLEAAWARLRKPLEGIAEGLGRALPKADVEAFVAAYTNHILSEESALRDLYERWLDAGDREVLGRAMAARRGVGPGRA